jgi:hypothetical protein
MDWDISCMFWDLSSLLSIPFFLHGYNGICFSKQDKKKKKKNIPALCVCEVILLFIICFKIVIYFLNTLYILSIYKLYLFDFLMKSYVLSLFYFYFKIIKKEVHIYIC